LKEVNDCSVYLGGDGCVVDVGCVVWAEARVK